MNKKIAKLLIPITLIFFFIATVFGLIQDFFMITCKWVYKAIKDEDDND